MCGWKPSSTFSIEPPVGDGPIGSERRIHFFPQFLPAWNPPEEQFPVEHPRRFRPDVKTDQVEEPEQTAGVVDIRLYALSVLRANFTPISAPTAARAVACGKEAISSLPYRKPLQQTEEIGFSM